MILHRYVDVPVIHKLSDDSLRFAVARFHKNVFEVIGSGGKGREEEEVEKNPDTKSKHEWKYTDIEKLVVRSRPLHLDVRFKQMERLRMCTAEIQTVVCELYYRSHCQVEFEDGPLPRFSYNVEKRGLSYKINKNREVFICSLFISLEQFRRKHSRLFGDQRKRGRSYLLLQCL